MADVFISYSSEDGNITEQICDELEDKNISCWYSKRDHKSGFFPEAIMKAISECKIFLLISTQHSNSSDYVKTEIYAAFSRFIEDNNSIDIQCFCPDNYVPEDGTFKLFLGMFPRINGNGGQDRKADFTDMVNRIIERYEAANAQTANMNQNAGSDDESNNNPHDNENYDEDVDATGGVEEQIKKDSEIQLEQKLKKDAEVASKAIKERERRKLFTGIFVKWLCILRPIAVAVAMITLFVGTYWILRYLEIDSVSNPSEHQTDSPVVDESLKKYQEAERLAGQSGKMSHYKAAFLWGELNDYRDAKERSFAIWKKYRTHETLSAGFSHIIGVTNGGSVVSIGDSQYGQRDLSGWTEVVDVSAGENHSVGLRDGHEIITAGDDSYKQRSGLPYFADIISVGAGYSHTIVLRADGTVYIAGYRGAYITERMPQPAPPSPSRFPTAQASASVPSMPLGLTPEEQFRQWKRNDYVAVSAGGSHTVGLHADGTVFAAGDNSYGQCNVSDWTEIIAIGAGNDHTVGLKVDGTVEYAGLNNNGRAERIQEWRDIIAIAAGDSHTVGLTSNGFVVAAGAKEGAHLIVSDWEDVAAVSAGWNFTVGLCRNGTLLYAGDSQADWSKLSSWDGKIRQPVSVE